MLEFRFKKPDLLFPGRELCEVNISSFYYTEETDGGGISIYFFGNLL